MKSDVQSEDLLSKASAPVINIAKRRIGMASINDHWERLKLVAREMVKDAATLAIAEYRQAYPKDMGASSPHLPEAITARVIVKLDELFYSAAKLLREQEEADKAVEKGRASVNSPKTPKNRL